MDIGWSFGILLSKNQIKIISGPARQGNQNTRMQINGSILGKRAVTPDTSFRLGKFFNTSAEFWMNLQVNVEMWDTLQSD